MDQLEEHYKKNYRILCLRVKNRVGGLVNAEDVVQESYCRALKYYKSFDGEQDIGAWFNTILNNASKDFAGAERRQGMATSGLLRNDDENNMEWVAEIADLQAELKKHSPLTQEVLRLHLCCGYSRSDIVQVLDTTRDAVNKIVQRFRLKAEAQQ